MNLTATDKQDLKSFISQSLSISKSKAKELIDTKQVFVNNKRVWIATYDLKPGDTVSLDTAAAAPKDSKIKILYEDANILAADKPSGIVTDKTGDSLESVLRKQINNPKLFAIHRLDKETTGVNLFAKSYNVFETYKNMWSEKQVEKIYYAVSTGEALFGEETVTEPIEKKSAVSHVTLVSKGFGLSLFKVGMETGRKHQIRIHLKYLGHPVLGDKTYGPNVIQGEWKKSIKRQMLHAHIIMFLDPISEKNVKIVSPFPADFMDAAAKTGWNGIQ
jgi:23S rRNA pseudouridine1911/1915/1917 synthase